MSRLGVAEGEARRNSLAMRSSAMSGLSMHIAVKAAAVERLMPAQQWMSIGACAPTA